MKRVRIDLRAEAPGAIATVLGVVLLRLSLFSSVYQRYVKVSARPILIAAGSVLIILGVIGVLRVRAEARRVLVGGGHDGDGHHADGHHVAGRHDNGRHDNGRHDDEDEHHHAPTAALLLLVPVIAVFMVAPPALGSYAASRAETKLLAASLTKATDLPPAVDGVVPLTLIDFQERTSVGENLTVGKYSLIGFVAKDPGATQGEFDLTRITIVCCAADAQTTVVPVAGIGNVPPQDTWVRVVGSEIVVNRIPELTAISLQRIKPPDDPYGS
jgi:uncharacterized repeat protein (TIGR03943 family)